jgi:hypothetical protein
MKEIPLDVCEDTSIFKDDHFFIVKDPKHKIESFHYTAWIKYPELKSILDIQKKHIPMLRNIIKKFGIHFTTAACNYRVLIHFPPSFWRLHLHFVHPNHKIPNETPVDDVFDAYEVINNILNDEDFYRKKVKISKL